ncbi:ZntA Cation transport ATPase [Candidatus Nanopelagicaceae bacterium]
MSERFFNWGLLLSTSFMLIIGLEYSGAWAIAGIFGLIPAAAWFIRDIKEHTMGSDVLAIFSIVGALLIGENLAASIIAVMLATGRVLESWAEGQAERQLKTLLSRMPRNAHRKNSDGSISEVLIDDIAIGDQILVRSGEITPTDGLLIDSATLDESALTGEPLPVNRYAGDEVSSGVVNASAPFYFSATTTSQASTYASIVKLVREAQKKSAPGIRVANTWALRFVPIALAMAGVAWWITGDVRRAVAVLVVATPCPLILAVPIAIVAGLSQAAKHGAIIKGGAVLELLGRTEVVLLDKTGTLTHGGPAVTEINTKPGISDDELLILAASVDQFSPHIVAKALVAEARSRNLLLSAVEDINEVSGHHIEGVINGVRVRVGQLTQAHPAWLHFSHPLMVSVESNGVLLGVIGLEDPIRKEARGFVSALRDTGISRIALVTGDRDETAQSVAAEVGITEIYSHITAAGKLEIAEKFKSDCTGSVILVGDGINDAPALAAADVGVAMGARGASAASEAADVVIVEDSIDRLTHAIRIARASRRKAIQAAGIGMGLAFVGMVLGACGVITPSQGAIAQEFIDVIAIAWALTALHS